MKRLHVYAIVLFVLVPLFYYLFLIPNFKLCVAEAGTWRACTQWLIR